MNSAMRAASATLLLASTALATDHFVAPGQTVQSGIDLAVSGDRVLVLPGTYVEQVDFNGKSIEVIGMQGAASTVLDGGGLGPVVRFAGGEGAGALLRGFTVTGGSASTGAGGIVCSAGATPRIEDCLVTLNSGRFGGGVSGSPTMRRCTIVGNSASLTHGGGLYGAPRLRYCVVAGNRCTSADGGGLYLVGGAAEVVDCVVVDNGAVFANSSGGGVYVDSTATARIERTVVAANFATGGAFAGLGGGVYAEAPGTLVVGCTITANRLSGSSTQGAGTFGPVTLIDTIVRGNIGGPDVSNADAVDWCDVGGGAAGNGNVDVDPAYVDVPGRDWHLTALSPLRDAGDPGRLDPDGTRADIGAFPFATLYTAANTRDEDWSSPSWPEVSASVGGRQVLRVLVDPSLAGQPYLTLGSTHGSLPGTDLFGLHVPLNPDRYLRYTYLHPDGSVLSGSRGHVDGAGGATTVVTLEPDPSGALAGTTLHHATGVFVSGAPVLDAVTDAVALRLVP